MKNNGVRLGKMVISQKQYDEAKEELKEIMK